uniref:Uncharacterized protein n=1 Tax=Geoglobus ahangari TaxID=113653 RepID=A0A7C3YGH0_9EURY
MWVIELPRSATLLRINPEAVEDVLRVFKNIGQEIPYLEDLAIFIKVFEKHNHYYLGYILVDLKDRIMVKKRVDGEIETKPQSVLRCEEIKFAYFPKISGSTEISHVTVVLGRENIARLLATVIEKVVGRTAFLRVRFSFTPSNEATIRNVFDDIVRIHGEDIVDAVISGISIKGSRLYMASPEYQKALTGEIKHIGVALRDEWFIVSSSGRVTTYKRLSDEEFIERIHQILMRFLGAGAVVF